MLIEVEGDILLSKAKAIAHGVAPGEHLDRGLALTLREAWPAYAKDFRHYCRTQHPKPGEVWTWTAANGLRIISLFTQEPAPDEHARPGRAKSEYVNHALRALVRELEKEHIPSVALPRLATGLGGLEWTEVEPLLRARLAEYSGQAFLYRVFRPGQAADEPASAKSQGTPSSGAETSKDGRAAHRR